MKPSDFTCIQLVIGSAGDGKTHFIRSQMSMCPYNLTIAVNEAFTPLSAIRKLNTLPSTVTGCAIFFNFTLAPYQKDIIQLDDLMEMINWFFYDLLILGYVEDPITGESYRVPGGLEWAIYIEIPSLSHEYRPEDSLNMFRELVPALCLLGSPHLIHHGTHYSVDSDVQLVCKYLRAYKVQRKNKVQAGINRLYKEGKRFPYLSIYLSLYLFIYLSIYLSIYLFVCIYLFIYIFVKYIK